MASFIGHDRAMVPYLASASIRRRRRHLSTGAALGGLEPGRIDVSAMLARFLGAFEDGSTGSSFHHRARQAD
jgi:hypothetical protein